MTYIYRLYEYGKTEIGQKLNRMEADHIWRTHQRGRQCVQSRFLADHTYAYAGAIAAQLRHMDPDDEQEGVVRLEAATSEAYGRAA